MKLELVSVGGRWPAWVRDGVDDYQKRYPAWLGFSERHVSLSPRTKSTPLSNAMSADALKQLKGIEDNTLVIGLERKGKLVSSEHVAQTIQEMRNDGRRAAIMIGGPEGLAPQVLERANLIWSLSAAVMAHPVVRVMMAEQIYRACSILEGSPYHRGVSTL